MIKIKDEKVIVNGKEAILFGGELHYFRVPKHDWKSRIRQVKEAGANMISTYVPWIFHEIEEGKIDLTGTTLPERDLKTFLQLVSEEGLYCLVRPGPYVMAEVVDHGVPTWFIENYPEAVAKTNDGKNHPTRVVSYMHPVFLEKSEKWYKEVCAIIEPFQITNGGPVILFQIDNEVGMFHWVTNQPDYNEATLTQFEDYLRGKYTREDFENTFRVPYEEMKELSHTMLKKPEAIYAHALRNEFGLFLREHYRTFLETLKHSAEEKGINVPFVVNVHGFHTIDLLKRGTMYPIGISQLLEAAKIENVLMAGDYYIGNIEYDNYIDIVLANAFTKAIQWKEQPLFSAEFQGGSIHDKPRLQPTTFDLTTRLCVADGMNGVNYYMFAGGENYENIGLFGRRHEWQAPLSANGDKRPHYFVIKHLGEMLITYESPLARTKPVADTHLGFYPDYYMTEFYDEHTKAMVDEIQHGREVYLYNGVAKGLRTNNIIFEGANLMSEEELDPARVPTLWLFTTKWMDERIQLKLVRYLENGGQLILFPTIPVKTMKNVPCTVLRDYIGVQIKCHKHRGFAHIDEVDNVQAEFMETYEIETGAFAWSEDGDHDVIAFEKSLGKGKLIMFGVGMEFNFNHQFDCIMNLAKKAGINSRFSLDDELDITLRSDSDGGKFIFLHNFDEYKKTTVLNYKGEALLGGKQLVVPQRSGLMLPIDVSLRDDLTISYGSGEIYKIEHNQDKLVLSLRVTQEEEEFIFKSSEWVPVESTAATVSNLGPDQYKVVVQSRMETESIHFQLKQ
ncbi:beta-galactosidase [Bacillus sp. T33-2]|uniref:beta-galactosidase n=1 Tax=Bacillus sp. T33-2 TaxID=2054168 RepID=UPI000C76DF2E|nr:beta-galactosidase [Bacillus sp. T33-2]PLR99072.1 beta-galactosidase [Bacillus sp. T33-2]